MVDLILGNRVLEAGLITLDAEATHLYVCNAQPGTYFEATSTYALGSKNFGAGSVFASPAAASPGRSVTSVAVADGVITAAGTVAYWAVTDNANSRLLATGALTGGAAVTLGQNFTLGSFTIQLPGEVGTVIPPSGVQAWDPANKSSNIVLSGSNLIATGGATATENVRGVIGLSSGKVYWETVITNDNSGGFGVGVCDDTFIMGDEAGSVNLTFAFSDSTIYVTGGGGPVATIPGGVMETGGVLGHALDITNKRYWITTNGITWTMDGDPVAGTDFMNLAALGSPPQAFGYPLYPALDIRNSGVVITGRFTTGSYSYTPPSGYGNWV